MMIHKRLTRQGALLLIAAAAVAGMLHAAEGDRYRLLDDSSLRQGPDSSYAPVGVAREGEEAVELAAKGAWLKVRIPASGDEGWLYMDSLERSSDITTVEPAAAPEVALTAELNGGGATGAAAKGETATMSSPSTALFNDGAIADAGQAAVSQQGDLQVADALDDTAAVAPAEKTSTVEPAAAPSEQVAATVGNQQEAAVAVSQQGDLLVADVLDSVEAQSAAVPDEAQPDAQQAGSESVTGKRVAAHAAAVEQGRLVVSNKQQKIIEADALDEQFEASLEASSQMSGAPAVQAQAAQQPVPVTRPAEGVVAGSRGQQVVEADVLQQPLPADASVVTRSEAVQTAQAPETAPAPIVEPVEPAATAARTAETVAMEPVAAAPAAQSPAAQSVKAGESGSRHEQTLAVEMLDSETAESGSRASTAHAAQQAPAQAEPAAVTTAVEATASGMQEVVKTTTIRTGPGSMYDVLGWIGRGARVEALGRRGDWLQVRMTASGRSGWIEAGALQALDEEAAAVVRQERMPQTTEGVAEAQPSVVASSEQSAAAQQASESVIASTQQSTALDSQTPEAGRPDEKATSKGRPAALASERAAKPAASAEFAPVLTDAKVSTPQPEVVPVKQAQVETLPVETVKAPAAPQGRNLFSFNRKANLRAGPDTKYDVVSWAGIGSYATELARKGDWVRVQMQVSKRIGWVYSRSLELVKAGVNLPLSRVASDQVVEQPEPRRIIRSAQRKPTAGDNLYLFKQTGNLRAGPGKQYDVVAWGGKHETASVIADKGEWRRVRMTVSGKIGWVYHTLLAKAGPDRAAVLAKAGRSAAPHAAARPAHDQAAAATPAVYQALRTEPLRVDAQRFAELSGWLSKGETVALLEQRDGWMRVKPQRDGVQDGWVRAELLKLADGVAAGTAESAGVIIPPSEMLSGADRVVEYQDRISKGEDFNFSYAALEQALYRVPIEDIHVRIARDDLKALFRKDTYDKSSFEIRLKTGRRNLSGRIKVLGSSTRIFKKKSLLIKLDKQSSRWYGRRRIALRAMASDKALMREWMAWKMMAAMGMKVPEVHFTRVSFNHGTKTGLYLSIEWMGRQFLAANKLEASGGFYQPNDASHCGDLSTSEHMELCFDKIAPQDGDYSMLSAMAQAVEEATPENIDRVLEQYFDADSVINWIAVNALVTNGDTYNKNYWLQYSPGSKKWTLIPWDYNLTFGRVYDPYAQKPFKIFNDNFQYFFPPDVGAGNPLKDKVVRNPRLRAKLEARLKHLLGIEPNGPEETFGWFSPTVMQARIGNLAAVVGKEVYKDTFLTYGEEEFTKTYESLMHYVTAHDHYLKAKLLGPYRWQPSPPFDPSQPAVLEPLPKELYGHGIIKADGQSLHMTDQGWGYFVAHLDLDAPLQQPAEFKVQVEGAATPQYLPPAQSARRCVQRSWLLSTTTRNLSVDGSLMVEYIQENSKRTEVPETLHEELLELWVRDGHHWKPLKTEVNEYANTLTARGVHLESGHVLRFVACSPF